MKQMKSILVMFLCCLLVACTAKEKEQLPVYQSLNDLKGKKLAVMTGSFYESTIEKAYPDVEVIRIDNPADLFQALIAKRCEAIVMEDYIFLYQSQTIKGLTAEVQHHVQLLTEEVLQVVPLDKGEIDLSLRYSEKDGSLSLELLMPTSLTTV